MTHLRFFTFCTSSDSSRTPRVRPATVSSASVRAFHLPYYHSCYKVWSIYRGEGLAWFIRFSIGVSPRTTNYSMFLNMVSLSNRRRPGYTMNLVLKWMAPGLACTTAPGSAAPRARAGRIACSPRSPSGKAENIRWAMHSFTSVVESAQARHQTVALVHIPETPSDAVLVWWSITWCGY